MTPMTAAERQARRRAKLKENGRRQLLVSLDAAHVEMLARISAELDVDRDSALARCIEAAARGLENTTARRKKRKALQEIAPDEGRPMGKDQDVVFRVKG